MGYIFSKSLRTTLLVFLSAFLLLSTKGFSDEFAQMAKQKKLSWLFLQSATSGSLKKIKGDSGQYLLKLKGVSPSMIAFTDRPARHARVRTTSYFVKRWYEYQGKDNYRNNPPNASLILSSDGLKDVIVLTLEHPKYNEKTHTLSYRVKPIKVVNNHKSKQHLVHLRKKLPKNFHKAVLFIDDSWGSLGG